MKRCGCESGGEGGRWVHAYSMTRMKSTYSSLTVAVTWRHVIVWLDRKIAEKQLLASSRLSARLFVQTEQLGSNCIGFHEIWYPRNFRKYFEKILSLITYLTRMTGTVHEDLCTFMTIFCWILHRTRNVWDKIFRENQNTHFIYNNFCPKIVPLMR